MTTPDFLCHPTHGIACMTPAAQIKLALEHLTRPQRVSLPRPVAAKYLADQEDDNGHE